MDTRLSLDVPSRRVRPRWTPSLVSHPTPGLPDLTTDFSGHCSTLGHPRLNHLSRGPSCLVHHGTPRHTLTPLPYRVTSTSPWVPLLTDRERREFTEAQGVVCRYSTRKKPLRWSLRPCASYYLPSRKVTGLRGRSTDCGRRLFTAYDTSRQGLCSSRTPPLSRGVYGGRKGDVTTHLPWVPSPTPPHRRTSSVQM